MPPERGASHHAPFPARAWLGVRGPKEGPGRNGRARADQTAPAPGSPPFLSEQSERTTAREQGGGARQGGKGGRPGEGEGREGADITLKTKQAGRRRGAANGAPSEARPATRRRSRKIEPSRPAPEGEKAAPRRRRPTQETGEINRPGLTSWRAEPQPAIEAGAAGWGAQAERAGPVHHYKLAEWYRRICAGTVRPSAVEAAPTCRGSG